MIEKSNRPTSKRRWLQFSIRALLLMMVVTGFLFGWLGYRMRQANQQRVAAAAIDELGGSVMYDYQRLPVSGFQWDHSAKVPGPVWLRRLLGDDIFIDVIYVNLYASNMPDSEARHLRGLRQLKFLDLSGTKLADAGLANLADMTQLEFLGLCDTQVTDSGIVYLKGMTRLKRLDISGTEISNEGVMEVQRILPKVGVERRH